MAAADDGVLAEQVAYYRARADEYDRWFFREGRYDRGEEATAAWFREVEEVRDVLSAVPLDGARVLELAPGTGLWTERIAARASSVVAVDASEEMIGHCRRRLGDLASRVEFRVADIFAWEPDETFDAVMFCFWISHVPDDKLDSFLSTVARALRPGGAVFFLDGKRDHRSTAADHVLPGEGSEVMTRRLDDGREFTIVKNFRPAAGLSARCAAAGLVVDVRETASYLQYGVGHRAS